MNQSTIYLLHSLCQISRSSIVEQISQIVICFSLIYVGISSAVNNYLNIILPHLFSDSVKISDIQFFIAFSHIGEDKLVIAFWAQICISCPN